MARKVDHELLEKIESIGLSPANEAWRKAMKASGWKRSAKFFAMRI